MTTIVIGVGNPHMGDAALGIRALERLLSEYVLPHDVEVVDGSAWDLELLALFEEADRILFVDSLDVGVEPGTPIRLCRSELLRAVAHDPAPHQLPLREALLAADRRGALPAQTVALGVQPANQDSGDELSSRDAAAMPALLSWIVAQLGDWGHRCRRRATAEFPAVH